MEDLSRWLALFMIPAGQTTQVSLPGETAFTHLHTHCLPLLWALMNVAQGGLGITVSQHSSCPPLGSCLNTSLPPPAPTPITMHSLDEPLDLKLSITKLRAAREKRERTLSVVRHRALHRELGLVDDSPAPCSPGSPPSGTAPGQGHGLWALMELWQ